MQRQTIQRKHVTSSEIRNEQELEQLRLAAEADKRAAEVHLRVHGDVDPAADDCLLAIDEVLGSLVVDAVQPTVE